MKTCNGNLELPPGPKQKIMRRVGAVFIFTGVIKKFSAWPSSVRNKITIVFASYSSKDQNTTCAIWLLGYKYFVHFSIWIKCLSDGVANANTKTAHKFLTNFLNDFESEQQSMQWNERVGQNCHFITCLNFTFSCLMQTTDDR